MLKFPDVFGEGLGQLDGQYKIRLDETVPPVQHAPRRIAVALRSQLKDTLDALEAQGIIAQVTTPTRWISSIVAVPKKNGKLRICLDPKDLNRAIQREKYQLPTVEDIATRLLVNLETDHKPLEAIFIKPLAATPKRLQRMLLRLQKYNLQVK